MKLSIFILFGLLIFSPIYGSSYVTTTGVFNDDYVKINVKGATASWFNAKGGGVNHTAEFTLIEKKKCIKSVSVKVNGEKKDLKKGKAVSIRVDKSDFTFEVSYKIDKKIKISKKDADKMGGSHAKYEAIFKVIDPKKEKTNKKDCIKKGKKIKNKN